MLETLIWAGVVLLPVMTAVLCLLPSARRAIDRWGALDPATDAERDAAAQETLAGIAERRHKLAISQALIGEETAREKARLEAETAQYETDAEAARVCLEPAVAARTRALEARAEAEAALAPEAAARAMNDGDDLAVLGEAYAAFCNAYGYANVPTFGQWIGTFKGLA